MQTDELQEIDRVFQSIPAAAVADGSDRRDSLRFAFVTQQMVAPYSGKDMPRAADFRLVPCHDISAGGMSFYWDRAIDFEYVVVALEWAASSLRMIGRMTFCVQEGDHNFRVGCHFIKRLK